ncbi:hypothetical protein [Streptomyces sp. NPDC002547]
MTRHHTEPDELSGPYGTAHRIPPANYTANLAALDGWIITAPSWHPVWSQYLLDVISLDDTPGLPPARKYFPGATHELMVVVLNPDHGPYDARTFGAPDGLSFLAPVNIGEQFTGTDEQARRLSFLSAQAVVAGLLCPETGDAPDRVRASWRASIHQTLTHNHDPHH